MHSAAAYRSLIERLEREAAARPRWYKFKLTLLAMLGYAFLIAAIVVALALSLGIGLLLLLTKSVWALKLIKFVWIPLVLAWMILKALWVRLTGPEGHLLGPGEAPELVAEVERLRQATGAPRLSGIVIDARFNAAAASVPRMLGLAGSRHFLILGLPLMRALGPDQLAAVIAHEFGHFNAGHGRYAGWIYRVRESWYRLLDSMQQEGARMGGIFTRFFSWYAPYFNAYSFVFARGNEYEADAVSARLVGADSMGQALVRAKTVDKTDSMVGSVAASGADIEDAPMIKAVRDVAGQISTAFEAEIDAGRMTMSDLFDQNYKPVPGSDPQQVTTSATEFTDRILPKFQEPAAAGNDSIVFCAAVDTNGYLPTHNAKFSKPQGDDPVWNAANCRNRRIFDDRVGLRAGKNTKPYLLQTYRRDMGGGNFVLMKDVSAPIMVKGRHWGGLRLAYKPS